MIPSVSGFYFAKYVSFQARFWEIVMVGKGKVWVPTQEKDKLVTVTPEHFAFGVMVKAVPEDTGTADSQQNEHLAMLLGKANERITELETENREREYSINFLKANGPLTESR